MTDQTTPAADDQAAALNRQYLTTLGALGVASHRLDRIRDAARLHRQQLIGTSELYAVIEADTPAVSSAVRAPATGRTVVLSDAERQMLAYALDQAQERIWSEGGFTDEDQAAVDSLRRLADEAAAPDQTDDETAPYPPVVRYQPEGREDFGWVAVSGQKATAEEASAAVEHVRRCFPDRHFRIVEETQTARVIVSDPEPVVGGAQQSTEARP